MPPEESWNGENVHIHTHAGIAVMQAGSNGGWADTHTYIHTRIHIYTTYSQTGMQAATASAHT